MTSLETKSVEKREGNPLLKWGTFAAGVSLIASLTGCSPQYKSLQSGTFTKLPPPPNEARLQIGVSTEEDGSIFINYVCWDRDAGKFIRKDIHYSVMSSAWSVIPNGEFRQAGGYVQAIKDGEVLSGGQVVDQARGTIMIGGGLFIDGQTGNVINHTGQLIKALER